MGADDSERFAARPEAEGRTGGARSAGPRTGAHPGASSATGANATGAHPTDPHSRGSRVTGAHAARAQTTGAHATGALATGRYAAARSSMRPDGPATGAHASGTGASAAVSTGPQSTGAHATGPRTAGPRTTGAVAAEAATGGSRGTGAHATGGYATGALRTGGARRADTPEHGSSRTPQISASPVPPSAVPQSAWSSDTSAQRTSFQNTPARNASVHHTSAASATPRNAPDAHPFAVPAFGRYDSIGHHDSTSRYDGIGRPEPSAVPSTPQPGSLRPGPGMSAREAGRGHGTAGADAPEARPGGAAPDRPTGADRGAGRTTTAGRRRAPGGHRKRTRRSFPAVPVAAGVATLVAATSGALTLQGDGKKALMSVDENRSIPAGVALNALTVNEARKDAATRSDRSARAGISSPSDLAAGSLAEAEERAAWEARLEREHAELEKRAGEGDFARVMERAIHYVLPLTDFRLTSGFGDSGTMWVHDHTGQDFAAPLGTPVRAVGSGEITYAGYDGSYGYKIVVEHADGTETWYCHLSGFARQSGVVYPGETIGYVGSTGNSSGPHLHFEVRPYGGDPIDPLPWLRQFGLPI